MTICIQFELMFHQVQADFKRTQNRKGAKMLTPMPTGKPGPSGAAGMLLA
jgi:hypothetical protein